MIPSPFALPAFWLALAKTIFAEVLTPGLHPASRKAWLRAWEGARRDQDPSVFVSNILNRPRCCRFHIIGDTPAVMALDLNGAARRAVAEAMRAVVEAEVE